MSDVTIRSCKPSSISAFPQYASISAFDDDDHGDDEDDEDRMDKYDVEESDMTFWCLNYISYISTFEDDDETFAFRRIEAHLKQLMSRKPCWHSLYNCQHCHFLVTRI